MSGGGNGMSSSFGGSDPNGYGLQPPPQPPAPFGVGTLMQRYGQGPNVPLINGPTYPGNFFPQSQGAPTQGGMSPGMSQTMDTGMGSPTNPSAPGSYGQQPVNLFAQGGGTSGLPPSGMTLGNPGNGSGPLSNGSSPGSYGQQSVNLFQPQMSQPNIQQQPPQPPPDPAVQAYMNQNYFPGIHGGPDPSMLAGSLNQQQAPGDMNKVAQVNQPSNPFARTTGPQGTVNGPGGLGFTPPGQPTQLFGPTAGLFGGATRPPGTPNNFGYYPGTQQWGAPNMGWASQWGKQPGV